MQDPEPDNSRSWKPTRSVYGGSTVGSFLAILLVPFIIPFYPHSVDASQLTIAITGLCVFGASYFIPD